MKKYIIISFLVALIFAGCEQKVLGPVLDLEAVSASSITAPADNTSFVLEEANADQQLTTFKWSATDYGFAAGVDYTLQLDVVDGMFTSPITLATVNTLEWGNITVGDFNTTMLANGVPDNAESDVYVRLMMTIADDVPAIYSDPITIKVTPYLVDIDYPVLRVPGSYQGWDPANDSTVIYSLKSDGNFEGYAYFGADSDLYKFTDGPNWDVNWGDTGLDGTLDPSGDDIPVGTAGVYRLNVNLNDLTYTSVATAWGLIGDATPGGWDNDTDMTFDEASGTLKVTLDLTAGMIKFRANDDWAINLGDDNANGSLEYNGADIEITDPGNYTVELVLNKPVYTYNLTKN